MSIELKSANKEDVHIEFGNRVYFSRTFEKIVIRLNICGDE